MEHRKQEHENMTPKCTITLTGYFYYGANCWLRHGEDYEQERLGEASKQKIEKIWDNVPISII